MKIQMFVAALACAAPSVAASEAPNAKIDMATVQKWAQVSLSHYHVEGAFHKWTPVSKRWAAAEGDVTDSMTVDFDWDLNRRSLVGDATFSNGASSVAGMRSATKDCPAAVIAGAYEQFTAVTAGANASGGVEVRGTRTYAPTKSPVECPASNALIATPGDEVDAVVTLPVADPRLLGVGLTGDSKVSVSADRKSFTIVGDDGWTWTMTPTALK